MIRIVIGLAIAVLFATASFAQVELPEWALQVLFPGERAVHVKDYGKQGFNDGNPAFIIAASAEGDSLGGRVITVWLKGEDVVQSVDCAWVASDLSGSHKYVRVFDSITLADARAAIEAARPQLLANEFIWKVQLQEISSPRMEGAMEIVRFRTGAIGVCAGTEGRSVGREFEIKNVAGVLVAAYNGRRWYY